MARKCFFCLLFLVGCWIAAVNSHHQDGSVQSAEPDHTPVSVLSRTLYQEISAENEMTMPSVEVFSIALKGFNNLKSVPGAVKKHILTIVDFSLPSDKKRLWVIDLKSKKILFHDLVAHGKNSGEVYARKFSNEQSTYMSSLGFYITGGTYQGKHGLSLILDGKDKNFNDNARNRAIVMHGASYVSPDFIRNYGRLGRSFGCPAVSMDIYKKVIAAIRDGSCLFIYYPDHQFLAKSKVLNQNNELLSYLN